MKKNPIDLKIDQNNKRATASAETAARTSTRLRKFGPNPTCWKCGYQNVTVLVESSASTKLVNTFEGHHVVGRNHEASLTTAVCRNCHAELTEALRAGGVPMRAQVSFAETLIACLTALAFFFRELAETFLRWAERIRTEGLSLDTGRANA